MKLNLTNTLKGLLIMGIIGFLGCTRYENVKKAEYSREGIMEVYSGMKKGPGIAAADMDGDGLIDLLSVDRGGNVYIHKNLGDFQFEP